MKKRTAITIITLLSIVAVAASAVSVVSINRCIKNDRYIATNYRHAFEELVTGVTDLDNALKKSVLVTSSGMAGAVCSEVFAKAQTADMAMGILPFSSTELEKTTAFINKVRDYAFSLSQKAASGQEFTQEEKENLKSLSDTASVLTMNLKSIQETMGSGLVSLEQYERTLKSFDEREEEFIPQTAGDSMGVAEAEFPEIPALIYDGPFSEHIADIQPRMLEGKDKIDKSEGRKAAARFLGVRAEQVYPTGEVKGKIPSYTYETQLGNANVSVTVSKAGGLVYQVLNSRYVETAQLSPKEAIDMAKTFLERRGYTDMKESYYLISDNILTANFAWVQEGIVCYSDLLKVGIALDDGSLQSFEASGYITSHYQRELPAVEVSLETAEGKVPEELTVLGSGDVLIPNSGQREILCHEYECEDINEQRFIIYVNAVTGEQEKIMIVLEDENGTLTI